MISYLAAGLIGDRAEIVDQVFIQPDGDSHFSRFKRWPRHDSAPLALALVKAVVNRPEPQIVDESSAGRWIYQPRLQFEDGTIYLLRVVVDENDEPPAIVTVYRTSKIEKYWSSE